MADYSEREEFDYNSYAPPIKKRRPYEKESYEQTYSYDSQR